MSRVHKVAAVQFEPTMFEKEGNIARLLELCEAVATAGARLIVTPEMGTTGYCWLDRTEVAPFVETIPGPTTDRFAALAHKHDCYTLRFSSAWTSISSRRRGWPRCAAPT